MKMILLLAFIILTLTSCATVSYVTPERVEVKYSRLFNQSLEGLEVEKVKQENGDMITTVKLAKQNANNEVIKAFLEGILNSMK